MLVLMMSVLLLGGLRIKYAQQRLVNYFRQ